MEYTVPGVYVREIPSLPPSVASVGTAIPAFIGHTNNHIALGGTIGNNTTPPKVVIRKISSFLEYQQIFGGPNGDVVLTNGSPNVTFGFVLYRMYYGLQHYFMNGGGTCYIVSVGIYGKPTQDGVTEGLKALDTYDEPTLYVLPDYIKFSFLQTIVEEAAFKCAALGDRMLLVDIDTAAWKTNQTASPLWVRTASLGNTGSYCAAYTPALETTIAPQVDDAAIRAAATTIVATVPTFQPALYNQLKAAIAALPTITLGATPAVAAAYVVNDAKRGVAHAPANMPVIGVVRPTIAFNESELGSLNVDATGGKSINVIRSFTGKGTLIWGARTLDGNSNEWRYVPVRRFYNMVEESLKKATMAYVFESNNANTWQAIKTMTANFLTLQWREGALQGTKPSEAFFVKVGLGETMSAQDILEGRLIVQVGMAVNRPAEFIILQFSHFMVGNA